MENKVPLKADRKGKILYRIISGGTCARHRIMLHKAFLRQPITQSLTVVLAFNCSSRQEIVDAARRIAGEVMEKRLSLEDLDEETVEGFLYTAGIPDPDL